jgi:Holliday junction resolvase RusA-like endonuclease
MDLELPFPPSVNHLWRRVGHRTVLSRSGRTFHRSVRVILVQMGVQPIAGRLAVAIDLHPPDRRRRDLDNALKALLDALQNGGAYHDDAQIDDLHIRRGDCVPGGRVYVRLVQRPEPGAVEGEEPPVMPVTATGGEKLRTCLKCSKLFSSTGPGHRICPRCGQANIRLRLSEPELRRQRGAKRHNGEDLGDDA